MYHTEPLLISSPLMLNRSLRMSSTPAMMQKVPLPTIEETTRDTQAREQSLSASRQQQQQHQQYLYRFRNVSNARKLRRIQRRVLLDIVEERTNEKDVMSTRGRADSFASTDSESSIW